ncbi:MAG: hypothetical protein PHH23_06650 [Paludibacteraceae bacterium]|nr:hypothetical protein [Paludibacteraceae bacterium]
MKLNKKKAFLFGGCGLLVLIAIVVIWAANKKTTKTTTTQISGGTSTGNGTNSNAANGGFPLKSSLSYNSKVMDLQEKLNARIIGLVPPVVPYDEKGKQIEQLKVDGYFGSKTLSVVKFVFNTETVSEAQFNSL